MSAVIATLTMNPALDLATGVERVIPTRKLRCNGLRRDPGGGGINVARVIHTLGGAATAIYTAGGPTGELLTHLLAESGIPHHPVAIDGFTREDFTVNEQVSGDQYRFVLPGPTLTVAEQQRCLEAVAALSPRPAYLIASGSLPPGVPDGFYTQLAQLARATGMRLVLDTSGEPLRQAHGAYLIKPNRNELAQLAGRALSGETELRDAARRLLDEGRADVVVVSLGRDGALLATAQECRHFPALDVPIRSTVGAGDTMVAAIVFALAQGSDLIDALRLGIAASAATLLTPGTGLCRLEDVRRLYQSV
jgi:6-phosphofructokinase 2